MKTIDEHFIDWERHVFGYGYGTGEMPVLSVLKVFLEAIGEDGAYDFEDIEAAVTPPVAWLLINVLCHAGILNYGTSPRYGCLSRPHGVALRDYVLSRSVEELYEILSRKNENYTECFPHGCNCNGWAEGREAVEACGNPFWRIR